MPAEGFVTVVPVEKVGVRTDKRNRDQRKPIGDTWSSRDQSPCTARLRYCNTSDLIVTKYMLNFTRTFITHIIH